jgi:hypothetical protein
MDLLALFTVIIDIFMAAFFFWRVTRKKATLWKESRIIYWWIALNIVYHALGYGFAFIHPLYADSIRHALLLPFVALFSLNPFLVAIIHWKGGHII